jgi:hypothetical protein
MSQNRIENLESSISIGSGFARADRRARPHRIRVPGKRTDGTYDRAAVGPRGCDHLAWRRSPKALGALACLVALVSAAYSDPLPGSTLSPTVLADTHSRPVVWSPGKVTVLSFFAFWCDTWKDQSPRLLKARSALAGLPVDVLTISVDGRWSDVPGYDTNLPLLLDRNGWSVKMGVDRVPTTVIVDPSGVIRWVRSGVVRTDDVIRESRAALTPVADGAVTLRLENFPPPVGGFEILDILRRLDVHAQLVLNPTAKTSDALVQQAIRQGQTLAGQLPKHGIVDPYDETRPGVGEIVRRIVLGAAPGATIVLHCDVAQTRQALPDLIAALKRRGLAL